MSEIQVDILDWILFNPIITLCRDRHTVLDRHFALLLMDGWKKDMS